LPDLAPAVALQQRLVRLTLDATSALAATPLLALEPATILGKWQKGLPLLRNEVIPIPPGLKDILQPICTALADAGAGESALHIGAAIAARSIDADSLLGVSLARNQKAIRTSALHMGFSPDLVWLIGELGSAPLAYRLSAGLKASTTIATREAGDVRSADLQAGQAGHVRSADLQVGRHWRLGYCPFCGSWPAFIEAHGGKRALRCSYCALEWAPASNSCVYCGHTGSDFVVAAPDVQQPQRRLELCGRCSGYTKVIDVEDPTPFPLLAIEDLATLSLDQGAMERGYRRPELFDLDAIEPRASTC
jgi:FdhE protein